ncbi:putative mitochondrial transferase [Heterostelium album PN500]|uniref:Putative mitochondrial transferase n=1 Tax=Heterostelium pallidum (strain ATCC 26659 / Pp 5 / PN500) TaxID=670386 RepID=D3B5T6_HETP5|nr:putative mitochondrial transferase [Heterostelium album PN500]EFA83234.1 putative mitochondrial transferase [Heterostelium album PN500]|eukprot:XP_020435351.1 putative mitochondrial transferase [Heterostelium album PN500]
MINISRIRDLKKCVIPLTSRSILKVSGPDAVKLVQGLTTNNMGRLVDSQAPSPTSLYTGFLSSTGRLLFDAVVFHQQNVEVISSSASRVAKSDGSSGEQQLFIDVDSEVASRAIEHLHYYKIRNKATIENVTEEFALFSVLDKTYKSVRNDQLFEHLKQQKCTVMMDPRHDAMGLRILVPSSKNSMKNEVLSNYPEEKEDVYNLYRVQNGIPQGVKDYSYDKVIPLEYNFDLLNGVDFHKGCYLGQELTSRTHYTGLIRKRLFPVVMSSDSPKEHSVKKEHHLLFSQSVVDSLDVQAPPADTELKITILTGSTSPFNEKQPHQHSNTPPPPPSRTTEKVISSYNNIGLAIVKVDHIDSASFKSTNIKDPKGRSLELLEPCWWSKVVGIQVPTQQVS